MTLSEAKNIADNPEAHTTDVCLNAYIRLRRSYAHVTAGDRGMERLGRRLDRLAAHLTTAGVKAQPMLGRPPIFAKPL